MSPYLNEVPHWKNKLPKFSHILFDADAIITLMSFGAEGLIEELIREKFVLCFIEPVRTQLVATERGNQRADRLELLSECEFYRLPITEVMFQESRLVQQYLSRHNCFPDPTDLYLAGTLAINTNLFLATSNLKDFPTPLFIRKAFILLQGKKNTKVISLLEINKAILKEEKNLAHLE